MIVPYLPKVSLDRGPSIVSTCETLRHSTNATALFLLRSLEPYHSSLHCHGFQVLEACRNLFPRFAGWARDSFNWTWGTTLTHTSRTLRLVWLGSFPLSGWVANRSFDPSIVLAVSPTLLLLPLRPVESLSLFRRQGCP